MLIPPIGTATTGADFIAAEIDYDFMRNLILYWDHIAALSLSEAKLQIDPSLSFLIEEKILNIQKIKTEPLRDGITKSYEGPPDYAFRSTQAQMIYDVAIIKAFEKLSKDQNSFWSYHEPPWGFLVAPNGAARQSPVLQIRLQNILPKPASNVSFDDILTFKYKRKDELKNLQVEILSLVRDAESDPNLARGQLLAGHTIQDSIRALDRVSAESGLTSALRGSVNVSIAVAGASAAFAAVAATLNQSNPEIFQVPVNFAAASGAGVGLISSMFFSERAILNWPHRALSFKYAHDVKKLFLSQINFCIKIYNK